MPGRVCLRCGGVTGKPSPRGLCPDCQADYDAERPARAVYDSPAWRRLSSRAIGAHVARHGYTCPGYKVPAHPSRDLTLDHPTALASGGAPLPRNPGVLCRSCNGRKQANTPATA